MTIFEEIPALSPIQFFDLSWDCPYVKGALMATKEFRLPSTAELLDEESFADLYMGWNEKGIALEVRAKSRSAEDAVELFFDTRNLKTKARTSQFCHQFLFTPEEQEGVRGREVTRFRSDESHRLADPRDLEVAVESSESAYRMRIQIPASSLHGYDPHQFKRLGFTYRILRSGDAQHFAISSREFALEQHPSLWATFNLVGRS